MGVLTEDEQFTYDKLGNRESVNLRDGTDQDYAVNSLTNRYDNDAGEDIVCEYDDAGNTIVDPNGYQYAYDYENRIIGIKDKEDTPVAEYAYDALGRRIQVYDMVAETKTRYYYNNNWQVLTETDEAGDEQRSYIYGNYIDEVLTMIDHTDSDAEYYYAHDHLYSPAALIESDGDIVERYEYDAYGKTYFLDANFNLLEIQKSAYGNPCLFTGKHVDILDDGYLLLQYSNNRYLHYNMGRWLTPDPLGIVPNPPFPNIFEPIGQLLDNSYNVYEYVSTNPVKNMDVYGLWGYDVHFGDTFRMALLSGICFPYDVADWANEPDEDWDKTPVINSAISVTIIKLLPDKLILDNPIVTLAKGRLKNVAYWHFPGADEGLPVEPDSIFAKREIQQGVMDCDIKKFSKGLHQLQDSWSHQSGGKFPPVEDMVGHSRDQYGWYWEKWDDPIANPLMTDDNVTALPAFLKNKVLKELRRIEVVRSHDADNTGIFTDDARLAVDATYNWMTIFMNACPCIKRPFFGGYRNHPSRCGRSQKNDTYLKERFPKK